MKLKPMADNILLKAHEEKETTVSGIILATSNKEKPAIYEVVSVGPGTKDLTLDKEEYKFVKQDDILAIVTD